MDLEDELDVVSTMGYDAVVDEYRGSEDFEVNRDLKKSFPFFGFRENEDNHIERQIINTCWRLRFPHASGVFDDD